jgi:error-prone DNA polymerase, DnaE-like (EC 2.7.7.7)
MANPLPGYAELVCRSNFTFLTGASHPEELVERAAELGYAGLAISDDCTLAGVVRAHDAAKAAGFPLMVASQFRLAAVAKSQSGSGREKAKATDADAGPRVVLIARSRAGYGDLSELVTRARRRADKGDYHALASDIDDLGCAECAAILIGEPGRAAFADDVRWFAQRFGGRGWIGFQRGLRSDDAHRLAALQSIGDAHRLPLVAVGDVLMHRRSRKPVQDTLTAVRLGVPLARCGRALAGNAEQHLRSRLRLARLYPPALLEQTLAIAESCHFSLDQLRYEYPREITPDGETLPGYLRRCVDAGALIRYPHGTPKAVQKQIEYELALIAELRYEAYFLTVYDIVRFAREREILCQGAGRRRIRRCAIASASPRSTRRAAICCSSASCRRSERSRPTSTSISSTSAAKR